MVELTAAHWIYALFIILVLVTMAMRKDTPVVCIVGSFTLAWVITGDVVKAVQAVFNAVSVAFGELLGTVLIISLIVSMAKMLEECGLAGVRGVIIISAGFKEVGEEGVELERLVLGRKLAHGDNPVLTWMADNLIARTDPAGNIKPDKERSKEKIDGIVALLMGLGWAMRKQTETGHSVYDSRDVRRL